MKNKSHNQVHFLNKTKRLDKSKLKKKSKEVGKRHREQETLQKKFRFLEQEMTDLYIKNKDKKSEIPNLLKKLGQLNEVRGELGLPMKLLDEYKHLKKGTLNQVDISAYGYDQGPSVPIPEPTIPIISIDPNGPDFQDLSQIPIPRGIAPETEGQIYRSLDLRAIKCKVYHQKSLEPKKPLEPVSIEPERQEPRIVISAAPQKRDLLKEVVRLVPTSVKRNTLTKSEKDPLDYLS